MKSGLITVICPVRNEQEYIENIITFFLKAHPVDKELFIVDGNSTDKTREIVLNYCKRYDNIHLLDNPEQTVPFALNKAIRSGSGNLIVRLDAHTIYADDYFEKILETFDKTGADIVGGPMRATGKTDFQKAVAYCTSVKFGVGDSQFHDEKIEGFVDSVYLGAWRRSVFEKTGLFDEEMLRNQDDEFHYRAKSMGLKIYLNPEIKSWYFPRNNFISLSRQYFQYGLFKPLVLNKVKSGMKLRHLIPSAFVIYCLIFPPLFCFIHSIVFIPLILYLFLNFCFSVFTKSNFPVKIYSFFIYPVLHISYGTGFICGIRGKNIKIFFRN